jgi:hypothetical protein
MSIGVVNLFQEFGILVHARGAERVRWRAHRDDEFVVRDGELRVRCRDFALVPALDGSCLRVHGDRGRLEEGGVAGLAREEPAHRLDERASLDGPDGDARQERGVEEEVARGDHGHVVEGRVDVLE